VHHSNLTPLSTQSWTRIDFPHYHNHQRIPA
jgi:hypothetical protein